MNRLRFPLIVAALFCFAGNVLGQQPAPTKPEPKPAAPAPPTSPTSPTTPGPDTKDPKLARDVHDYNLPKHEPGKAALAIEGYDPVAYFPEGGGKPAKGKADLAYTHRGVEYRFATQANLDAFKKDPEKYEPAYGGWCAWAMADTGKKVEIDPKAFRITNGRLFLFYTDIFTDTRNSWKKDEPKHTVDADGHWKTLTKEEPRVTPKPSGPGH